jgi:HD superfamily phosphohydrolase
MEPTITDGKKYTDKETTYMNQKQNTIRSKAFWHSLLWKQNGYHQHGVLLHTLRVTYHVLKHKEYKMFPAALLHDIGKPFVAYQKPEDVIRKEYSFTDHEECSYQLIKNWSFVSTYTKELVRWHYLIRDISKHKTKDPKRHKEKKAIWENLSQEMQQDLQRFLKYDDLGKGR